MRAAFWRRVAFSAVTTLLLLFLVEGVLALCGFPSTGIYRGNLHTEWSLKPGLDTTVRHVQVDERFGLKTSSSGFRDDEIPESGTWVAALGCSTTFGWGVEAEQAWPEVLESLLGVEVLNAGVPGHSTHQGVQLALELLDEGPDVLILGWLVRDAQRSSRSDKSAKAPAGLRATRLFRAFAGAKKGGVTVSTGPYRVSPADYVGNLQVVIDAAKARGVKVLLLAFPMQTPATAHLDALHDLDVPKIHPTLAASSFFAEDPIHLNVAGNRLLAQALEPQVNGLLGRTSNVEVD